MPQFLPILAPLLGGVANTFLGKDAAGKRQEDFVDIFNRQMGDYQVGREGLFGKGNGTPGYASTAGDRNQTEQDRMTQALYGGDQGGMFGSLNDLIGQIFNPKSVQQNMGGGGDPHGQDMPGLQDFLAKMGGNQGGTQGTTDLARQVFAGGGWTPQSQNVFDQLGLMQQGQAVPQQGLMNMANNIFGSNGESQNPLSEMFRNAAAKGLSGTNQNLDFASQGAQGIAGAHGQTDPTNAGIGAASGLFANGGMTNPLSFLQGIGQSTLSKGGLTDTGAQGEKAALNVLNQGGSTQTTDQLQNRGLDLAGRESLLPMDRVASMARDEAGTDFQNNMEAALRMSQARGGGPGATVASGLQNQGLADYSDKGSQIEAQAVRDALTKQQGLQLQQAGLGANMAQQGGALENSRFGTASDLLGSLEGVAANRFGTSGNLVTGAQNAATNRAQTGLSGLDQLAGLQSGREMGALGMMPGISNAGANWADTFGKMGLGSSGQNLEALGLGKDMYNSVLGTQLGANNSASNLIGTQGQYALGAGKLGNEGSMDIATMLQQMFSGNLAAGKQAIDRNTGMYDILNQGVQNRGKQQSFAGNQGQNAAGNLTSLMSLLFPYTENAAARSDVSAAQAAHPGTNPWGPIISAGANAAGGIKFGGNQGGYNPQDPYGDGRGGGG